MTIYDVVNLLRMPIADVGSGIIIHMYALEDGTFACISYNLNQNGDWVVSHIQKGETK